jgi:hypothetical protein
VRDPQQQRNPESDTAEPPSRAAPELRTNFQCFVPVTPRWNDNDVFGHINNAEYYAYFDTAVMNFMVRSGVVSITGGRLGTVVAETGCRFHGEAQSDTVSASFETMMCKRPPMVISFTFLSTEPRSARSLFPTMSGQFWAESELKPLMENPSVTHTQLQGKDKPETTAWHHLEQCPPDAVVELGGPAASPCPVTSRPTNVFRTTLILLQANLPCLNEYRQDNPKHNGEGTPDDIEQAHLP